jgi:hypothetical protein
VLVSENTFFVQLFDLYSNVTYVVTLTGGGGVCNREIGIERERERER